ncbi:PstS family phosphate ABC transporter substrate-binding protein [Synechococcus sp. CS-1324]|uniref:PstS family phosphate ABC transporter substrate-binding protein n=1 Tax=Synechococcus sp. CS-1324 TaxID=2847980 RepID=UPI000DAFE3B7|nr:PstS family phosphate ABC transporter substrate-binding protein [Synechococcus sp. CS-1324]MCT0230039.1 PstS family phosphate ABC transporter substrate-binding protein [Synechococcus sp. CS-1324]PZV03777.1 MAG: ABC transporter substrate-binding protein [Cyanobium sp.]
MVQRDRSIGSRWRNQGCFGLATALLLGGLPAGVARAQSAAAPIVISGSSTVFPITTEAIRAFRQTRAGRDVRFDLRETGTSAGFRDFCSGKVPISNASRPISSKELKACAARGIRFIELPIAFDALTVAVNPRNTWARQISTQELSTLWSRQAQGRINRWNQVNSSWPASPIKLCGPGKDSGTFDYFNKAINGSAENSRTDFSSSEDDNVVVKCIAGNPQALGYVGFGWYAANTAKLRAMAIKGAKGAVLPSVEAVQQERYNPLSRPLFIYVNNEMLLKQDNLRRFIKFYLQDGPRMAKTARFIPLPDSTYRLVESKLYRHVLGTSFGGDLPVGLTIGEALRRSFDQTKQPQFR